MTKQSGAWLNGAWLSSAKAAKDLDIELLLGPTLAENLRVKRGKAQHLPAHLARMAEACQALGLPEFDESALARALRLASSKLREGALRVRYFYNQNLLVIPIHLNPTREAKLRKQGGIRLMTSVMRHYGPESLPARAKAAAMLNNLLAKAETQLWSDEGLRLTPQGLVAEGVWSNIVIQKGKRILTPPLSQGILAGVERQNFLATCRKRRLQVLEQPLTRYDLHTADKAWITTSTYGAMPINEIDGRRLGAHS